MCPKRKYCLLSPVRLFIIFLKVVSSLSVIVRKNPSTLFWNSLSTVFIKLYIAFVNHSMPLLTRNRDGKAAMQILFPSPITGAVHLTSGLGPEK